MTSSKLAFQMAISLQRIVRSTSCLILGRVFGDDGSTGPTSGFTKSKMAASRHLGKFQMAISPQRVIRSTLRLILRWGFRRRRIEWTYFRLYQMQDSAARHLGTSRMTISQDSIYYETYGHVANDVTCRKWWLFKETHVARIPVRLPACCVLFVRHSRVCHCVS